MNSTFCFFFVKLQVSYYVFPKLSKWRNWQKTELRMFILLILYQHGTPRLLHVTLSLVNDSKFLPLIGWLGWLTLLTQTSLRALGSLSLVCARGWTSWIKESWQIAKFKLKYVEGQFLYTSCISQSLQGCVANSLIKISTNSELLTTSIWLSNMATSLVKSVF